MSIPAERYTRLIDGAKAELLSRYTGLSELARLQGKGFFVGMASEHDFKAFPNGWTYNTGNLRQTVATFSWVGSQWLERRANTAHLAIPLPGIPLAVRPQLVAMLSQWAIGDVHSGATYVKATYPTETIARWRALMCVSLTRCSITINDQPFQYVQFPGGTAPDCPMPFVYSDGGRGAAGFRGTAGDCVVRAIAIATQKPYREVYDALNTLARSERVGKRKKRKSSSRTGVYPHTYHNYLKSIGWSWTPTMQVGQGCRVHLRPDELPAGRLIVRLSKHLSAVIDGVVYDTDNPSRDGTRCVYGYFSPMR